MTLMQKVIQIFVASPSDVREERALLESRINKLNLLWSRQFSLRFELVRWETHTYPDIGTDPQAVINSQIPQDYDVFIGILWSRFGSPTPRYGSGTEEEFRNAFNRYRQNQSAPKIMLYFNQLPVAVGLIDGEQIIKVQAFKREIASLGIYYSDYNGVDSFDDMIEVHLSRVFHDFVGGMGSVSVLSAKSEKILSDKASHSALDDDNGLLDYLVVVQEASSQIFDVTQKISASFEKFTNETEQNAAEINRYDPTTLDAREAKKLIAKAAASMERLRIDATPLFSQLKGITTELLGGFSGIIVLSADAADIKKEDVVRASQGISSLKDAFRTNVETINVLIDTISTMPRLTKDFNASRRKTVDMLKEHVQSFVEFCEIAETSIEALSKLDAS